MSNLQTNYRLMQNNQIMYSNTDLNEVLNLKHTIEDLFQDKSKKFIWIKHYLTQDHLFLRNSIFDNSELSITQKEEFCGMLKTFWVIV